jgi:multidrug efflux pump subunit AcrA (membrane-fusion protein)
LAVAQAQVDAAKANLQAVQVHIDQLIVTTPISGVVMTRNIETGELIQPGVAAMTISQLDAMTVTVYVSETQYGSIPSRSVSSTPRSRALLIKLSTLHATCKPRRNAKLQFMP